MKLTFAPMEGITTYVYRNAHAEIFGGCDEYYAPFISPSEQERISRKEMKDILPERNENISLKVQVIANKAEPVVKFAGKVKQLGYDEINLNLGCPAGTVVKKGRGSGFLKYPDLIDEFLYGIFENTDIKVSVKTRTGFSSHNEMEELMKIYNKYPLSLLIIHPRTREMLYGGVPDMNTFDNAYNISKSSVCYNGNICSVEDFNKIKECYPELDSVMIGRGGVRNPALFREIKGGKPITVSEVLEFSHLLIDNYREALNSDVFTLHKLKEIWVHMINLFPDDKKISKAIKKSRTLADFTAAIESLPKETNY